MRRFPAIGLAISLLALPLAARAVVPDPRFQGALVGGTGPATIATRSPARRPNEINAFAAFDTSRCRSA